MGMSCILPLSCFLEPIQMPSNLSLFNLNPENSWNYSTMEIASFFSSFIVRVVSSANCFIFVVLVCKFSFLSSFTCMPLTSGLFLILITSISTAIINRSGLNGHPWRIPLSVGNQLDSQPPFWTQLCVASIAVWINFWKWDPKLKMSRASLMHLLDRVSKAFEKSRATSACFFLAKIFC